MHGERYNPVVGSLKDKFTMENFGGDGGCPVPALGLVLLATLQVAAGEIRVQWAEHRLHAAIKRRSLTETPALMRRRHDGGAAKASTEAEPGSARMPAFSRSGFPERLPSGNLPEGDGMMERSGAMDATPLVTPVSPPR